MQATDIVRGGRHAMARSAPRRAGLPLIDAGGGGQNAAGVAVAGPVPARARAGHKGQILTTRVGLRLPAALPFETWQAAGRKLFQTADSFAWCLGDWLVYGQDKYGDRYRQAVEAAGLDYQTLRNYAWVARKFDVSRRHPQLSFQHHAEVAALRPGDQDVWLARAHDNGWSKTELRRRVRAHRGSAERRGLARLPLVQVESEALTRWQAAAELAGKPFADWVTSALDVAACGTAKHCDAG
ncbi:LmbU family transcriptional regulator [Streptomyces rubradiris]|nr:LmbU family transcriptional regulator [Streptomyces rubradiris]